MADVHARIYTRSITSRKGKIRHNKSFEAASSNVELVMSSRQQCEDILSRCPSWRFALNPSSDSLARPERLHYPSLLSVTVPTTSAVSLGPSSRGKRRDATGQEA